MFNLIRSQCMKRFIVLNATLLGFSATILTATAAIAQVVQSPSIKLNAGALPANTRIKMTLKKPIQLNLSELSKDVYFTNANRVIITNGQVIPLEKDREALIESINPTNVMCELGLFFSDKNAISSSNILEIPAQAMEFRPLTNSGTFVVPDQKNGIVRASAIWAANGVDSKAGWSDDPSDIAILHIHVSQNFKGNALAVDKMEERFSGGVSEQDFVECFGRDNFELSVENIK